MLGVVLCGGLGSRLHPLTLITNKHLLPIADKPMVYYPIQTLIECGVREILLVTGGNHAGNFLNLLGNGQAFGLNKLYYAYQTGEGGIAEALKLAKHFANGQPICVILGDNIFESSLDISKGLSEFRAAPTGAHVFVKRVDDPERFGVLEVDTDGNPISIVEKPHQPLSNLAVVGCYLYDNKVFDICDTLKPSGRGELEISDVNSLYLEVNQLTYSEIQGWWTDAGTFKSLQKATNLVAATNM